MVESLQMFLFLFKSKYRRKYSWYSPFLCSVLIVLLFCHYVASRCSEQNCVNGVCNNETCECFDGWQGPECQYCGGKVKLTELSGIITDGPGNYSVSVQCTWLIQPEQIGLDPPPIRIRLENFATECGWDHLYVYDGDSVRAERLLAVYSGILQPGESTWTRQVVARSGSALLHFFSDDAYAMEGFNLTYSAYSCPSDNHYTNCSNHGVCESGTCRCERDWLGDACDESLCPDECNAKYGGGTCTESGCVCAETRSGADCGRDSSLGGWTRAWPEGAGQGEGEGEDGPPAIAAHALLHYGDSLWTVGGEMFRQGEFMYRYHIASKKWSAVEATNSPVPRILHTAIIYNHEVIVYGGVLLTGDTKGSGLSGLEGRAQSATNEVWRVRLDGARPVWHNHTPPLCSRPPIVVASPAAAAALAAATAVTDHCGGLHLSGHTAVLAYIGAARTPVMLVFFGHSPYYGYLHIVQEYYIEEGVWSVARTRGWPARGGFGHSAVYDELSGRVYVHGGLLSESEATQAPSSALHEYDIENRIWRPLPSSSTPRYLHTATFVSPGVMLVFGGNAHNDSVTNPGGSRCYSGGALLYDVRCSSWHEVPSPMTSPRAAHAAVLLPGREPNTVLIHGGFDGRLRSDALQYSIGSERGACSRRSAAECGAAVSRAARSCLWRLRERVCVPIEEVGWKDSFDENNNRACVEKPTFDEARCLSGESCAACTAAGCVWCGACVASAAFCPRHRHQMALSMEECSEGAEAARESCARFHSCAACHAHRALPPHATDELGPRVCYWDYDTIKCRPANITEDMRGVATAGPCSAPCSTFQTCSNCTAEECIWCASAARCVDKNAYGASFPLGGCRAWASSGGVSGCGAWAGCGAHASCGACLAEPACGWCDDGQGGGRGVCVPGAANRPHAPALCAAHRWHFTQCPACQCNGHSICDVQNRCIQPCAGRSVGAHCEQCAPGHWGTPLNGARCQPCECNAQAVSCAADTGRCYCSTKGLAGERCDKCDNTNHYHADLYNKGACYYDLAVDYQFTFNLSKKEDRHLSAINFRNAPVKADVDADFSIACSSPARLNLTVRSRAEPAERALFTHLNCTNFKYKFSKSEHLFGVEDNVTLTTFFVYVYDFKPPLWIQISFSQYPKLNLQQFFITFSSCFLLLLMVAAGMWKIKQRYDLFRRRQRLFVEMEQMASRPFSQVCVELEKSAGAESGVPAPVALEPCRSGRAAVLSLLVRLPTGRTGRAPPLGGLAVASALVTLGHHHPAKRPTHI